MNDRDAPGQPHRRPGRSAATADAQGCSGGEPSRPVAPVAALLTPPGRGALAVVGVAGPGAGDLVTRLFRPFAGGLPASGVRVGRWAPVLPGGAGEEVVVTVVPKGGWSVHEVHCHGGAAAPAHVLGGLAAGGATVIDWRQWLGHLGTGVVDIEAREALCRVGGPRAASILARQLTGTLDRAFADLRRLVDENPAAARALGSRLRAAAVIGLRLVDPWRVVLAGPVNAGKSSLVNALAGHARSIVSPVPGTTRDLLVTPVVLHGWEIDLVDTAGHRAPGEPAAPTESAGIAAAARAAADADLVLLVREAGAAAPPVVGPADLVVVTKHDRVPNAHVPRGAIATSAITGTGIDTLAKAIVARLVPTGRSDPDLLVGAVPFTARQIAEIDAILGGPGPPEGDLDQ